MMNTKRNKALGITVVPQEASAPAKKHKGKGKNKGPTAPAPEGSWLSLILAPFEANSAAIDSRIFLRAYQGNRETQRAVDGCTGKQLPAALSAQHLKDQKFRFSEAEAKDGTIVRVYDVVGEENFRYFHSNRGKYDGKFGLSGKCRALLETARPDVQWNWEQQGSKNYFFSDQFGPLFAFLSNK